MVGVVGMHREQLDAEPSRAIVGGHDQRVTGQVVQAHVGAEWIGACAGRKETKRVCHQGDGVGHGQQPCHVGGAHDAHRLALSSQLAAIR